MRRYTLGAGLKSSRRMTRILGVGLIILLVALGSATVFVRYKYTQALKPLSGSQKTITVKVPLGSTAAEIGQLLQQNGVIKSSWAFEWYVRNHTLRDKLQAGTYTLRPSQSVEEIVNQLTFGKVASDLVTFLPGQRIDQIRQALIKSGYSAAETDKALDAATYKDHPALSDLPAGANLEGYLYPDSYQKTADTSAATIVKASLDEMQKYLTPAVRAGFVRHGLTVHEGVTLASIIEQEVGKASDRPIVAQVFLKRLAQNMALQSDVTVLYGALAEGQTPSLAYDSAYNTFKNKGLPVGPISNVSKTSLEAIANPADTDYLFFVAGDDGVTYFARTVQEHDANVAAHCKKLCNL